jgi:hypothetical protein
MCEDQNELTTRLTTTLLRCLAKALVMTADELEGSSGHRWEEPAAHNPKSLAHNNEVDATDL